MLFITQPEERPDGYVVLSESTQWVRWLNRNIPQELDRQVRRRLISNLKHLLVGLELKAALIYPHRLRSGAERPVLYEPYFQNLILEFCVATFSVMEGLGSAHWLSINGSSGADSPNVRRDRWLTALCVVYDGSGDAGLRGDVERTLSVRDRLHQDRVGARANIDWHAFSFEQAFAPASAAIRTIFRHDPELVPETTNLSGEPGGPERPDPPE